MRLHLIGISIAVVSGCSYTFNGNPPDLPLVGGPPPLSSFQKLNQNPVLSASILGGVDGAYWLALEEVQPQPDGKEHMRIVRLSPPDSEEAVSADQIILSGSSLFLVDDDTSTQGMSSTKVTVRSPGDAGPGTVFEFMSALPRSIVTGGRRDVFVYVADDPMATGYEIVRRDGSYRRTVTPDQSAGFNPTNPGQYGGFFYSCGGKLFFERDQQGNVIARSTVDENDIHMGQLPQALLLSQTCRALISCDKGGLLSTPFVENATPEVLDPNPCGPEFTYHNGEIYYFRGSSLWKVPFPSASARISFGDPSAPVKVIDLPSARFLAIGRDEQIIYSRDPPDRYINGVGDGWLGDWKFMQRGYSPNFSSDQKKIRWIDYAAQPSEIGDLYSAPIGGPPALLARNVANYIELADGRVLCTANQAFRGVQNRLVVVDEAAGELHWVADSADDFAFIPNSNDLLVDIITGATTSDLVRAPIPPKP